MDYLDLFAGDPRLAGDDWHPVFEMLKDHRAARFLKARGYDYIQFGSWWVGTHDSDIADENHPPASASSPATTCAAPSCAR